MGAEGRRFESCYPDTENQSLTKKFVRFFNYGEHEANTNFENTTSKDIINIRINLSFFLFHLVYTHHIPRISNARLLVEIRFRGTRKEDFRQNNAWPFMVILGMYLCIADGKAHYFFFVLAFVCSFEMLDSMRGGFLIAGNSTDKSLLASLSRYIRLMESKKSIG